MPDPSSDDPFADLFGKLPDPRSRELRSSSEDSAPGTGADTGAARGSSVADTGSVPLSRRAAREAAAQQSTTGAHEVAPPPPVPPLPAAPPAAAASVAAPTPAPSSQPAAPIQPAAPSPEASPLPAAPSQPATPPAASRIAAAQPETAPIEVNAHDEPWMFAGAEVAPAVPYGRGAASRESGPEAKRTDSIESLFAGHASTDDFGHLPPPKKKRRRRVGGWIALGVVLLLIGGVVTGGLWVWNTYEDKIREVMGWEEPKDYAYGEANGEAYVTIDEGDTGSPISQSLYDSGVTKTPTAFYDYLIDTQQNPPFVPGVFKMQKQMTSEAALAALLDPANKMENTALLREGLTVDASLPILAEATGLPIEDFEAAVADPSAYGVAADSLEGWLFPARYTFDPGVTAPQVIQALVDRTVESLDDAGVPVDDRQRVLTVASIIQREARFSDDFYKVSRVIENRLDPGNQETFGKLQMDSTAQYGYGENHDGTASSSAEALADDNPWNTYFHTGLPIGPIANPGDLAIDAAMHPADGDWLYFVAVNLDTGETVFTSNLADHNRAVAQWVSWCADHPDSGC